MLVIDRSKLKSRVIALRQSGFTYGEIQEKTGNILSKGTLSNWCSKISLSKEQRERIQEIVINNLKMARQVAWATNRRRKKNFLQKVYLLNSHLGSLQNNRDIAKVILAILYLTEGGKSRTTVCFGNSDPGIILLFLRLLRNCYVINEQKFRCTVQCRADQDIKDLEKYWSQITSIPPAQFYQARIDPRTIGKPSKKKAYKGVCRLDYLSSELYYELCTIGRIITGNMGALSSVG